MSRARARVALFTGVYMLAFGVHALARRNLEFLFYAVVLAALVALVLFLDRRVRFSPGVLWALSAAGLLHMAGGNIRFGGEILYDLPMIEGTLRYDQFVHAATCAIAAVALWQMLGAVAGGRPAMNVIWSLRRARAVAPSPPPSVR